MCLHLLALWFNKQGPPIQEPWPRLELDAVRGLTHSALLWRFTGHVAVEREFNIKDREITWGHFMRATVKTATSSPRQLRKLESLSSYFTKTDILTLYAHRPFEFSRPSNRRRPRRAESEDCVTSRCLVGRQHKSELPEDGRVSFSLKLLTSVHHDVMMSL